MPLLLATAFAAAASCATAARGEAKDQEVLAHGTDQWFWVLRTSAESGSGSPPAASGIAPVHVRVFGRASGEAWRQWWQPLGRRVESVASRDAQLAVLLDDGQWLLLSEYNAVSGRPIGTPAGPLQTARLIALAGQREVLWAVARVPGGIAALVPPATEPASGPTPTATRPATQVAAGTRPAARPGTQPASAPALLMRRVMVPEAPPVLSLVRLGPSGWLGVADLPPGVARAGEHDLSLVILDDSPLVAVRAFKGESRNVVEVYRLAGAASSAAGSAAGGSGAGRWEHIGSVSAPGEVRRHKLLAGATVPTLTVTPAAAGAPDLLYFFDRGRPPATTTSAATQSATRPTTGRGPTTGPAPVALQATTAGLPSQRDMAIAAGMIRAAYLVDQGGGKEPRLFEQRYDLRGAPDGPPVPFLAQGDATSPVTVWRWGVVTVAMIYAVAASFRRREQMRRLSLEQVRRTLAPVGTRLLAGMLDALPVVASMVVYLMRLEARGFEAATNGWYADPITWIGLGLYLLHTTASEMLTGRTMGKALVGLRVVSLDGSVPDLGQLLTRNLLRIIDAGLLFIPAMLVPLSPLRQRVGDAAAGTLVVSALQEGEEDGEAAGDERRDDEGGER